MLKRRGLALAAAFLIQFGSQAQASMLICEALFRPATTVELAIFADSNPHFMRGPILSQAELQTIFHGVPRIAQNVGSTALTYMKTHTHGYDSETLAQLWHELSTYGNKHANGFFFSELFVTDDGRFIFRGGAGETLFIDNDGKMYRTRTLPLERNPVWVADYATMKPLN